LDEVRIASHNNLSLAANVLELGAGGPREVQENLFFNVGSLVVLGWCPAPPRPFIPCSKRELFSVPHFAYSYERLVPRLCQWPELPL